MGEEADAIGATMRNLECSAIGPWRGNVSLWLLQLLHV